MKDIQRSFRLPAKLDRDVAAKAAEMDRSASWVICRSLEWMLYGDKTAKAMAFMRGATKEKNR